MSATPAPSGWVIQNADASAFSFVNAVNGVSSLSDQALEMKPNVPVILPNNSPGDVSETRVELSAMTTGSDDTPIGIVFAYQDIDNFLTLQTLLSGSDGDVSQVRVNERVNGSFNFLDAAGSGPLSIDPQAGWVDLRFQVFRPSGSEVSFRVSAAKHGNPYQSIGTLTLSDSGLPFTSGDVGLTSAAGFGTNTNTVDGDPVGSGGRPIKMYWA